MAAALSVKGKTIPRKLDVSLLQSKLIEQGLNLREEPSVGHQDVSPKLADKIRVKVGPGDNYVVEKKGKKEKGYLF